MKAILLILALILLFIIFIYNRLITLRNAVKNNWARIDTQLQRRYDLIPNLIETVKGYTAHEKEVLESVTKARTAFLNADTIAATAEAENML